MDDTQAQVKEQTSDIRARIPMAKTTDPDAIRELWHRLNPYLSKIISCSNPEKCKLDNELAYTRFGEVWEALDDLVIKWGLK